MKLQVLNNWKVDIGALFSLCLQAWYCSGTTNAEGKWWLQDAVRRRYQSVEISFFCEAVTAFPLPHLEKINIWKATDWTLTFLK